MFAEHPEMVDEVDDGGQTLAHYAARGGQLEVLSKSRMNLAALPNHLQYFLRLIDFVFVAAR